MWARLEHGGPSGHSGDGPDVPTRASEAVVTGPQGEIRTLRLAAPPDQRTRWVRDPHSGCASPTGCLRNGGETGCCGNGGATGIVGGDWL